MQCAACNRVNAEDARFCAGCGTALSAPGPVQADPMVGTVVGGRYRIVRRIARGGMGLVYAAEQQMGARAREVAVKVLEPWASQDERIAARFFRECSTVAELEHPHTIRVFDFGTVDTGSLYIAMEYVRGEPLGHVIAKHGPLPLPRVVRILQQIAGALHEAHELGIVHRDLKPDNIMLTEHTGLSDFVKVLDFGIAARVSASEEARETKLTRPGTVLGTPPYMSPEQCSAAALDRRSDIYSLGIIAYEMLSGRLPFEAASPMDWVLKHVHERPCPLRTHPACQTLPSGVEAAVHKALAKAPEHRQPTVLEFVSDVSSAVLAPADSTETMHSLPADALPQRVPPVLPTAPAPLPSLGEAGPVARLQMSQGATEPADLEDLHRQAARAAMVRQVGPVAGDTTGRAAYSRAQPGRVGVTRPSWLVVGLAAGVGGVAVTAAIVSLVRPSGEDSPGTLPREARTVLPRGTVSEAVPVVVPLASTCPDGMAEIDVGQGHPFCLDRTEVTVSAFKAWCASNDGTARQACRSAGNEAKCKPSTLRGAEQKQAYLSHPVNCVSWQEAAAYCTGKERRLPSAEEWVAAARGRKGRVYPWGNQAPDSTRVNACDRECEGWRRTSDGVTQADSDEHAEFSWSDGWKTTAPVDGFPRGRSPDPEAVSNLAGNVSEWALGLSKAEAVYCGGSWLSSTAGQLRVDTAGTSGGPCYAVDDKSVRSPEFGFRCARGR